jgi:hypothetical protein
MSIPIFSAAGVKGGHHHEQSYGGIGTYIFAALPKAKNIVAEPKVKESPSDS